MKKSQLKVSQHTHIHVIALYFVFHFTTRYEDEQNITKMVQSHLALWAPDKIHNLELHKRDDDSAADIFICIFIGGFVFYISIEWNMTFNSYRSYKMNSYYTLYI